MAPKSAPLIKARCLDVIPLQTLTTFIGEDRLNKLFCSKKMQ
jgi:hypothetical protein